MIDFLLIVPAVAGIAAFLIKSHRINRLLLLSTSIFHLCILACFWMSALPAENDKWLMLDYPGLLFLSIISVLFFASSVSVSAYLQDQAVVEVNGEAVETKHMNQSGFTGCLILFLTAMTFVCLSQNLGLLWIGIEATTLASAPLIFFHRTNHSLEATWKYLLICSVGIALALIGNILLSVSGQFSSGDNSVSLFIPELIKAAPQLNIAWLKAAFIFMLIGYGTKMGLAPMHTWLPDTHSESPSLVSALLSGALLNCAFLGILRGFTICVAAGEAVFARDLMIVLGVLSVITGAVFILGQTDYKRMLAYSSVEHMGILAIGMGLSGKAVFGVMYHAINHSIAKAMLFLVAGNILAYWKTKKVNDITGLLKVQPVTGFLWVIGFLAITGVPPFGVFFSEWIILREAFIQENYFVAVVYLISLAVIFLGMASIMLSMVQGGVPKNTSKFRKESRQSIVPSFILGVLALLMGLYLPEKLEEALRAIAAIMNGTVS